MRSPYDFIGTDKAGNKVARTDLMLLDALSRCTAPVSTAALVELADPRGLAQLTSGEAIRLLTVMLADGYVERGERLEFAAARVFWSITHKGSAHLIAEEAKDIFNECARHTPVGRDRRTTDKPRIEEDHTPLRTEAGAVLHEQLRGAHARLDDLGIAPAPETALLCVDEDELDEWWESMDVEMKADCFAGFALHMYNHIDSHIHVEQTSRVPILGTVGETPEQWAAFVDRCAGSVTDKVRRDGIAAVQS